MASSLRFILLRQWAIQSAFVATASQRIVNGIYRKGWQNVWLLHPQLIAWWEWGWNLRGLTIVLASMVLIFVEDNIFACPKNECITISSVSSLSFFLYPKPARLVAYFGPLSVYLSERWVRKAEWTSAINLGTDQWEGGKRSSLWKNRPLCEKRDVAAPHP